ncbi:MAG: redoxin domain-containing protein [Acidobacteriota bacterium]|nr:redoxin domain-containing protein [Acidobacteriota bacterium]
MVKQTSELRIAVAIILVASLSYAACQRSSESASQELKPRTSAVQIGEMAPDFTLEDQQNQKVTLSAARGSAPGVLVFYRGYW